MPDVMAERSLPRTLAPAIHVVERIDSLRRSSPAWSSLMLELLEVQLCSGTSFSFASLDEAGARLALAPNDSPKTIFVRWTSGGAPAAPGLRVFAVRLQRGESRFWVRGDDEVMVEGLAARVEAMLASGVSTRSGPPLDLPSLTGTPPRAHPRADAHVDQRRGVMARAGAVLRHPTGSNVVGGLVVAGVIAAIAKVAGFF
jgi:hypothetical protein